MKKGILFILLSVCCITLWGQKPELLWQKRLGGTYIDEGKAIYPTFDGGFITVSTTQSNDFDVTTNHSTHNEDIWVIKFDSVANIEWKRCYGGSYYEYASGVRQLADSTYLVFGRAYSYDGDLLYSIGGDDIWTFRLDHSGNIIWQFQYGSTSNETVYEVEPTPDKGYIIAGGSQGASNHVHFNYGGWDGWVVKIDSFGTILWEKNLGGSSSDQAEDIVLLSDGNYLVGGYTGSTDHDVSYKHGDYDIWLVKLDTVGNIIWEKTFGGTERDLLKSVIQTNDNGFLFVGTTKSNNGDVSFNHGGQDMWLVKTDDAGTIIWEKTIGGTFDDTPADVKQMANGEIVVSGTLTSSAGIENGYIARFNAQGDLIWQKTIGGSGTDNINGMYLRGGRRILCIGSSTSTDGDLSALAYHGYEDVWLFEHGLDTAWSYIRGNVFFDDDQNCVFDSLTDNWQAGAIVHIKSPYQHYTSSGNDGSYSIPVYDTGLYQIERVNLTYSQPSFAFGCNNFYDIQIDSVSTDTSGFDFDVRPLNCPILTTSIGVNRRTTCMVSNLQVEYCNRGNVAATNVVVLVQLSNYSNPLSADHPYTIRSDGRLEFQIGQVPPSFCGTIAIQDSIDCVPISVSTQLFACTQSWISPPNDCFNNTVNPGAGVWDSASLSVTVNCSFVDSSAYFLIRNTGSDMQTAQEFRIYSQTGLVYTDTFQLNGGDSLLIAVQGAGGLVRIEVDNTPGHPYQPTIFAETGDCPTGSVFNIDIDQYPTYDDDVATDVDCEVITGSFDPNDKKVAPSGILQDNYVKPNSQLEYTVRFQNTGTDTAYRVEVIDTLSEYLDIASLQLGASSHAYDFSVNGTDAPVLHWLFNNIYLVDSNTNEPLSHGYFKFKIAPYDSLPDFTVVENFADIYFDHNPPVRTNTPFVTLYDTVPTSTDEVLITSGNDTLFNSIRDTIIIRDTTIITDTVVINDTVYIHDTINGLQFIGVNEYKLYPNPNNGQQFVVEVSGINKHDLELEVYDPTGKKLRAFALKPKQTLIEPNLQNGFYFYRIVSGGQLLRSGKLLVIE